MEGDTLIGVKLCICARRALARNRLKIVPPAFHNPKLSTMKPRPDLHPSQAKMIASVRANPDESYLLLGRNGSGKSHVAWALYRYAVAGRRPVMACTVRDLLADFRRVEIGVPDGETLRPPRVTPADLRRSEQRWFLFLDEFEKARPTEFASEMLFNLLDTAKSFNHQLVVTSNFNVEQLREHWGRIDQVWGNSIMTRLQDCNQVEMF